MNTDRNVFRRLIHGAPILLYHCPSNAFTIPSTARPGVITSGRPNKDCDGKGAFMISTHMRLSRGLSFVASNLSMGKATSFDGGMCGGGS